VLQFGIMPLSRIHYGWVVAIAGAIIMSACSLASQTFGVFLTPLVLEFGWDRGPLSVAPSIAFFMLGLVSIVTGKLCDIYGPRILVTLSGIFMGAGLVLMAHVTTLVQVYVFWGVFLGLGLSCCLTPILITIPRWFIKKRGVAISIPFSGLALGAIVWPLLSQTLLSAYSLQHTFLILGIVAWFIMIPLAQFIRKDPAQMGQRAYGETVDMQDNTIVHGIQGLSFSEAMRTSPFWIFGTIQFLWFFCQQTVAVHIVPLATDKGIAEITAASILSVLAVFNIAGRISIGFISDKLGIRRALSLCLILVTITVGWLYFAKEIWAFYVFAFAFGLTYGGIAPMQMLVTSELFGLKSLGMIFAVIGFYGTIGGALGPALAGYIFDATGSYNMILVALPFICLIATVLALVLLKYRSKSTWDL
jgi:MFS family permease